MFIFINEVRTVTRREDFGKCIIFRLNKQCKISEAPMSFRSSKINGEIYYSNFNRNHIANILSNVYL